MHATGDTRCLRGSRCWSGSGEQRTRSKGAGWSRDCCFRGRCGAAAGPRRENSAHNQKVLIDNIDAHIFPQAMILQSAFHYYSHIILMIISIYPLLLACAKDLTIAKPGCVSTCGNVDIAYPFGMNDSNCYAHKFFEIECKNHKPYLATFNLEVTQIYVNVSTVEIKNPIYYSCQSKNAFINLTGSPYVYSQEYDKFMAIGCNKLGFLRSNGSKVGGCVSICDGDEAVGKVEFGNDGCHGRYCCETSLPMHVWEYNATIRDIIIGDGSESNTCSYAMIVSDAWLHSYGLGIQKLSNVENMIDVPAVLEWEIRYDMGINSTLSPSRACCDGSSLTSPSNTSSGFRCRCLDGYDGNPYIRGGCNGTIMLWTN
ncbi:Wall-associated receptor kinase-like [Arachis hypogaea]|nr:Wall-associated receptor kinase-like [Arachis hypogaea]